MFLVLSTVFVLGADCDEAKPVTEAPASVVDAGKAAAVTADAGPSSADAGQSSTTADK